MLKNNYKDAFVGLMQAGNTAFVQLSDLLSREGLTVQQFNVLRILRGQKGNPITLQAITEKMIHSNSNTTRIVDKLLQKKLVSRNLCKSNRRKLDISITSAGLDLLANLDPVVAKQEQNFFKELTQDEMARILSYVEKLILKQ